MREEREGGTGEGKRGRTEVRNGGMQSVSSGKFSCNL